MPMIDAAQLVFYALATVVTICSLGVVTARNAVTSAMFLVADLFALAGLYATMDAHFIAAIQVLIYAGAITVLFVFVIMLLNLSPDAKETVKLPAPEVFMLIVTLAAFAIVAGALAGGDMPAAAGEMTAAAIEKAGGNTYAIGMTLFTKYLWPFELASVLILLAIVAAVVIAKKEKPAGSAPAAGAAPLKGRTTHGVR
jgi:NADH-quinone oxidoreductase subunit J